MTHDKSELRASYRISALAEVVNTTRYVMERLLREAGVRSVKAGRTVIIPLSEIKEKIPLLWESLHTLHQAHRAGQEATKTNKTATRRGISRGRL